MMLLVAMRATSSPHASDATTQIIYAREDAPPSIESSIFLVAAAELKSETGLEIGPDRFFPVKSRQLATLSTHQSHLFAVELTSDEIKLVEVTEQQQTSFGVVEETEQTSVRVRSLAQILDSDIVDWSTIGMITNAPAAAGL